MPVPPIYLDHNATTPMDPAVLEAMRPHFLAGGNAESRHGFGRSARRAWEQAKETVAGILGAEPSEVIPALKRAFAQNEQNRPAYLEFICSQHPVHGGWVGR